MTKKRYKNLTEMRRAKALANLELWQLKTNNLKLRHSQGDVDSKDYGLGITYLNKMYDNNSWALLPKDL